MSVRGDMVTCQKPDPKSFYLSHGLVVRKPNAAGWACAGLCPFHDDRRVGSFYVNLETGSFKCFSCGVKGGDVIEFTKKKYNINFREALARLSYEWTYNE